MFWDAKIQNTRNYDAIQFMKTSITYAKENDKEERERRKERERKVEGKI